MGEGPRLKPFNWTGLAEDGFFRNMITAYAGAGLGLILFDSRGMDAPGWLIVNVPISILCAVVAFTRVWKTIREENETGPQWDGITLTGSDRAVDRFFEIPYLFALNVLPFSVILPQFFMGMLFLFYITDNFYNALLARGAAGLADDPQSYPVALVRGVIRGIGITPGDLPRGKRNRMANYFLLRSRYNTFFILLLFIGLIATFVFDSAALLIASAALLIVEFVELVVEPHRNVSDDLWADE
jgi:hypothetical protein